MHRPRPQFLRRRTTPDRPPRLHSPAAHGHLRREISDEMKRAAVAQPPFRRHAAAHALGPRVSAANAGQARDDLGAANLQKPAHEIEPAAMRLALTRAPIENGRSKGFLRQRIGPIAAEPRVGRFELGFASAAYSFAEVAGEVTEEWERLG